MNAQFAEGHKVRYVDGTESYLKNPYPVESKQFHQWNAGWSEADYIYG